MICVSGPVLFVGGFDMCWGDAPLGGDISTPSAAGQFDMCWDHQVATAPAITVEAATPPATTFDVCWDDRPATPAMEYKGESRPFVSVFRTYL